MEASELRIGNYYAIAENDGIKYKQIKYLVESESDFFSNGDNITQAAKPIPLTEEWLLKFGFEKIGGYLWDCKKLGENRFLNNPFSPTHFEVRGFIPKSHIQYVHQLQNLYFALTGEELTIKRYEKIKSNN